MIRKAFYMEVRPGKLGEYTHLHNPIPDELAAILKRHGVSNYSIFHHPATNVMFGYLEIASEAEFEKIASYECCHKWWKLMTRYLVTDSPDSAKAKEEPKGAKTSETCMRRSCIWSCGKCNIPDRKLCGNKSVRHNNYKR